MLFLRLRSSLFSPARVSVRCFRAARQRRTFPRLLLPCVLPPVFPPCVPACEQMAAWRGMMHVPRTTVHAALDDDHLHGIICACVHDAHDAGWGIRLSRALPVLACTALACGPARMPECGALGVTAVWFHACVRLSMPRAYMCTPTPTSA